jgi:hypothetical protein
MEALNNKDHSTILLTGYKWFIVDVTLGYVEPV